MPPLKNGPSMQKGRFCHLNMISSRPLMVGRQSDVRPFNNEGYAVRALLLFEKKKYRYHNGGRALQWRLSLEKGGDAE